MSKKRGLGKGLGDMGVPELLQELTTNVAAAHLSTLDMTQLIAGSMQPRVHFDPESLAELAESIQQQGIIQPLVVRPQGDKYEIIAGERRFRAAQIAGLNKIPCVVRALDDKNALAMALIENIQRHDLNAIEQANALARLIEDFSLTQAECAQQLGKSRSNIANLLRLLKLPPEVQQLVRNGALDMGHARALLALTPTQQSMIAKRVAAKAMSVRQTEEWVKWLNTPRRSATKVALTDSLIHKQKTIADKLATKVQLKQSNKGHGTLVIHFKDEQQLHNIFELLD